MTVSTATSRVQYDTNGTTGPWTVPYRFLQNSHLQVTYANAAGAETPLVLDTGYSVTGAGDATGTVTTTTAYVAGGTITIVRNLPETQETDYGENDPFPANTHEMRLDWLTMLVQQLSERLDRAISYPVSDDDPTVTLPSAADRALKAWTMDADGNLAFTAPAAGTAAALASDLLDSSQANNGGGMVGFSLETDYVGVQGAPSNIAQAIKEMLGTTTFTFYVSKTGNDGNDGSVSAPFATLQKAVDMLTAVGTVGGSRRISIGAGTYSGASERVCRIGPANPNEATPGSNYATGGISTVNHIIIEGPDVGYLPASNPEPTPTAIFDGGGAALVGLQIEGPIKVVVRNLKFINYSGSASSAGVAGDSSFIRTENVHTDGCAYGISSSNGRLEVRGGSHENATTVGVRSIFANYHSIGNPASSSPGEGPFFRNCPVGFLVQENSTGHSDNATYEDCSNGIRATVNSRVNFTGSEFARCDIGVRAEANSVVFHSTDDFNDGTADACTENIVLQTGAVDLSRDPYTNGGLATDYNDAFDLTATATSTAILSRTITRGSMCPNVLSTRKPQHIVLKGYGTFTGTNDIKQLKIKLGSTILASVSISAAYAGPWEAAGKITFTDSNAQSAFLKISLHGPTATAAALTDCYLSVDSVGTEDIAAADVSLTFEAQLGSAVADHITCPQGAAHFELWG